ncbi:hypothetical protein [Haloarcula argentinensis]|uniref:hypothetical protein n=1 Tax=Haloarcula argentinensis TaxID=43776 RepID=UPI0006775BC0|nr:hypothetical protein [Haloarcula argentinensis]
MNRKERLTYTIGLLGLAGATVSGASTPATSYELSILRATPPLFWVGVGLTIAIAIIGVFYLDRPHAKILAAGLGVAATVLIALLPALRGYYFYGLADSLQHLGWTKDIRITSAVIEENPYPGIHIMSELLARVMGIPARRTLLLIVPLYFALYALGASLLARLLLGQQGRAGYQAIAVGLLVSILTPPIIAPRLPNFQPIATDAGLFILPLAVYLGIRVASSSHRQQSIYLALLCILMSLTLYHPQQGLVAIVLLCVFALSGLLIPWQDNNLASGRVLSSGLVASIFLAWWLSTRELLGSAVTALITKLQASDTGASAATPGSAFEQIGGSVLTLFVKSLSIHLAIAIVTVVSSCLALYRVWAYYRDREGEPPVVSGQLVRYILGFLPVLGLVILYLPTGDIPQAVRYVGILVALGAPVTAAQLVSISNSQYRRVTLMVVLVLGASLAVPAMFRSPYLYSPTPHVTETQLDTYAWTFDNSQTATPVMSVNTDVKRQLLALEGFREGNRRWWVGEYNPDIETSRGVGFVPAHFANRSLTTLGRASTWHLVSTDYARQRNVELYDGLRFNEGDYAYLESNRQIHRVYTNGGAEVYQIQRNQTA